MKVTETHPGGEIREYTLEMKQGKTHAARTFGPDEEPIAIRILESGWLGVYHVLVEFGDYEQTDYHFLRAEQILEKFGIDIDACPKEFIVDHNIIYETPNLYDLGTKISREYFRLNHKTDPHTNNENLF